MTNILGNNHMQLPIIEERKTLINSTSWGYDRDKWQKSTKVYRRRGKDVSNAQALIWHAFDDKEPTWELV